MRTTLSTSRSAFRSFSNGSATGFASVIPIATRISGWQARRVLRFPPSSQLPLDAPQDQLVDGAERFFIRQLARPEGQMGDGAFVQVRIGEEDCDPCQRLC